MNTHELCNTIRERLEYEFRNVQLPSEGRGERAAPAVINSYLPPKRSVRADVDTDFPFVLVRPVRGRSTIDGSSVTVRLIVGVRNESRDEGVTSMLLIKDIILAALFRAPRHGVFTFEQTAEWVNFDDQQEPFYELWIDTDWSMYHPQLEGDGDER